MNATTPLQLQTDLTATPMPVAPKRAYFEQSWPVRTILASFFFLTLPVAAMVLFLPESESLSRLYFWLLGGTHIVITLTVYASRTNRIHFTHNRRALAIFVVTPVLILGAYLACFSWKMAGSVPLLAVAFWAFVRFMNFFHLNRQTFGVLQLVKARAQGRFPNWGKQLENLTGLALVATLMVTHASGGICPLLLGTWEPIYPMLMSANWLIPLWCLCAALSLGCFTASLIALTRPQTSRGSFESVAYFSLQCLGIAAATIFLPLYLASLAIHYVEYHILMIPRIAAQPLDSTSKIDRTFGWFRARPLLFILGLLILSALVTTGMGSMDFAPPEVKGLIAWGLVLSAFDALVLVHYILEMYIWKFSDPHFRNSMNGVYFTPRRPTLSVSA